MVTNQYGQIYAGAVNTVSADISERYPVLDRTIEAGDVVRISSSIAGDLDTLRSTAYVEKSAKPYDDRLVGVISTEPGLELGKDDFPNQPTRPVGLQGRVPVKVTDENGPIQPGDFLTSSATRPGFAMKATRSGMVIGKALGEHSSGVGTVMLFIDPGYHTINWAIELNDDLPDGQIQGTATGTPNTFAINQKGSGDILKLQENGESRFLFRNDGTFEINNRTDDDPTKSIVVVKANDAEIFKINARGDLALKGVIRLENDTFAGSVETDSQGFADVNFAYNLGTGKPVVQLTPESIDANAGSSQDPEVLRRQEIDGGGLLIAQISRFFQDDAKNYTGFRIRVAEMPSGKPAATTTIHYLVIAKQEGYTTSSTTPITVISPEEMASSLSEILVVEEPSSEPKEVEPPNILSGGSTSQTLTEPAPEAPAQPSPDATAGGAPSVSSEQAEPVPISDTATSTEPTTAIEPIATEPVLEPTVNSEATATTEPAPAPPPEPTPLVVSEAEPEPAPTPIPEPTPEPAPEPTPEPPPAEQL